jgi:glycerol-3-phosphate acyltransferase PlsX
LSNVTIAIDAMGGDHGPETVIPALASVCELHPQARFRIFGLANDVEAKIAEFPLLLERSSFIASEVAIAMDEKPGNALRRGRKTSSMWQAIDDVKSGHSHACISAGNTGALMAMSKVILRMMPGIERPALAAIWPTTHGECIVLDVGATIGISPAQYAQFAIMGQAYARIVLGIKTPRVALLNVGVEDMKGTDDIKEAARLLAESELNFMGFIEGDGIGQGQADVVVTDGFTGNVALKAAEGTARQVTQMLRESISASWLSRLGYLLARDAFAVLRERLNPNASNGGIFLGVNGIVVKSHGGADVGGFASAVEVAIDVAKAEMVKRIASDVEDMQVLLENAWAERLD